MNKFDKPWSHTVANVTKTPENLKIISFGRVAANTRYESLRKSLEDTRIKEGFRFVMKQINRIIDLLRDKGTDAVTVENMRKLAKSNFVIAFY